MQYFLQKNLTFILIYCEIIYVDYFKVYCHESRFMSK